MQEIWKREMPPTCPGYICEKEAKCIKSLVFYSSIYCNMVLDSIFEDHSVLPSDPITRIVLDKKEALRESAPKSIVKKNLLILRR